LEKVHHFQKSLPTLPLLPKLTALVLNNVRGLNEATVTFPTLSTSGLRLFELSHYVDSTDTSVSQMLDWILFSSSKTLEFLGIRSIGITEIPSQIPSFTALKYLSLTETAISTIKNGALSFSVPISYFWLRNNKINSFEPGAFQGIYILFAYVTSLIYA